jgi:hypothetical protein
MSSTGSYSVELADLARDRQMIIDLWSRNLLAHTARQHSARFDWHYGQNPTGASRCFLVRHSAAGQIVGTAGLGVRQVYVDGQRLNAGLAIDFAVDAQHRTLQPAVLLQRAVADSVNSNVQFLYALPNAKAQAVFRRVGYSEVAPFRRFVKVLDATEFLDRRQLPRLIRSSAVLAANFAQQMLDLGRSGLSAAFDLADIQWTDSRLNSIFQSACSRTPMIGDRQAAYLRWRFASCPLHDHKLLGLTPNGGSDLLGYVVVYGQHGGQLKIPDLLLSSGCPSGKALMAISRWARDQGFSSIAFEVVRPDESLLASLRQAGFIERELSDVLFILDNRPGSPARNKTWYFLRGDEFYNTF